MTLRMSVRLQVWVSTRTRMADTRKRAYQQHCARLSARLDFRLTQDYCRGLKVREGKAGGAKV